MVLCGTTMNYSVTAFSCIVVYVKAYLVSYTSYTFATLYMSEILVLDVLRTTYLQSDKVVIRNDYTVN